MLDRKELGTYKNITTATTTTVKKGVGSFLSLVVNDVASGSATGSITIYDNTAASGTVIGTPNAIPVGTTVVYACQFTNGLTIVTAAADDITVIYS